MTTTPDEAAAALQMPDAQPEPAPEVAALNPDLVRELASVTDMLKAREGEVKDLKERKRKLSEELLGTFELNGLDSVRVDGRLAYLHSPTYPVYLEKPADQGGGRYTAQDAVAVLRKIGRGAQVQPETVNHQTMGAILREYRDAKTALPEELAKIVRLEEAPEVRVRAPRK
jgi:hypothetical protein